MNKKEAKKIFGGNLRKLREARGISQEELSTAIGYSSRSSINKIEAGERDMPRSKIAIAAKVLRVEPSELFKDDPIDIVATIDKATGAVIDIEKLNDKNKAKLEAYYQALIDSQEDN